MWKYARLGFDIARDVLVGIILGLVFVVGIFIVGATLAFLLVVIAAACLLVLAIGTPILGVFIFVLILVGYPLASGRSIKAKVEEFKKSLGQAENQAAN